MNPAREVILNLAPSGMVPTKDVTPHVPTTPREIVAAVRRCVALGANVVHLHARDRDGRPTYKKELYARLIGGIREEFPDLVLCVSLSGRVHGAFSRRADPLSLSGDLKPDLASLTLGSMNFATAPSVNSPETIRRLAERMAERDIKPELEVFDLGMACYARVLIDQGLLRAPYYFNVIFGNVAGAQARPAHFGQLVAELPAGSVWTAGGIGRSQLPMNTLGLLFGRGARVGLEDAIWYDDERRELATNERLLARVVGLAAVFGKRPATPHEVRVLLGLAPAPAATPSAAAGPRPARPRGPALTGGRGG